MGPSHVGLKGNEEAENLANSIAIELMTDHHALTLSEIFTLRKIAANKLWDAHLKLPPTSQGKVSSRNLFERSPLLPNLDFSRGTSNLRSLKGKLLCLKSAEPTALDWCKSAPCISDGPKSLFYAVEFRMPHCR
ncbi:hypothetical protein CDAR_573261 [Caerostris darwini]|uniref:RNase H type-1 domain-containing protein n=1 Tax=Caerostris darwini TaxID=1538125 RepID=A0AAV4M3X0_9ARAC|nr:hypothetical protein CDAR_573261 [Caerostris darwini]